MRALLAALVALSVAAFATAAASAAGLLAVRVHVVDRDGRAVPDAVVFAKREAGEDALGTTDRAGDVAIEVAPGTPIYARLGAAQSPAAPATAGSARLVVPGLQTIGGVRARAPLGSIILNAQSAAAIVSGDVSSSLNYLPNYRSEAEGGSGTAQLDGTPLMLPPAGPGGGASRFGIPPNLVASLTPAQADDGSVSANFHLQSPTATPQRELSLALGSDGTASWKTTASGRAKRLGYAFALAGEGSGGKLAGRTFADQSGLDYDHSARAHRLDASMDLEWNAGGAQLSLVALGSRAAGLDVASVLPGAIAQGLGPGTLQSTNFANGYLRVARPRGRDTLSFLDVRFAGAQTEDDRSAVIALQPAGGYGGYRFSGRYDELAFTRAFGRDSVTAKLTSTATTTAVFADRFGAVARSGGTTMGLTFARAAAASSLRAELTASHQTGAFGATQLDASLSGQRWGPRSRFDWSVYSAQAQLMQTYYAQALQLGVPTSASFDCGSRSAFVGGPSDVAARAPHVTAVKANLSRRIGERVQVTAGGFASVTTNALAAAADAGAVDLPAGYLDALGTGYRSVCGAGALAASDVYLTRYVTVPRRVGREWYTTATAQLGALTGTASYETYSAYALGVPAPGPGAVSTLVDGAQLWNVPLHRASVLLAYPTARFTAAAGATYVSANNALHLPAYVSGSAGVRVRAGSGFLTLSRQHLFGGSTGIFTAARYAASTATTGRPVQFLGTPVEPAWTLRYDLRTGGVPSP
ncbi:MAG TPA: hypothetical protein VK669_04550 [Candidatus Limnocylindrales bacterium]|nr:hypothetical protein [Candidatus Limnocylindrales bacterium]